MNARNRFRYFLFAVTTAAISVWLQPVALAADQPRPTQQQLQDRDGLMCKKYLREHHGHPGKGVDVVKVVYVQCPKR